MRKKKIEVTQEEWDRILDEFLANNRYSSFARAMEAIVEYMNQYKIVKKNTK